MELYCISTGAPASLPIWFDGDVNDLTLNANYSVNTRMLNADTLAYGHTLSFENIFVAEDSNLYYCYVQTDYFSASDTADVESVNSVYGKTYFSI